MSTYIAGPWIGELGWELFCYQGHLRWLSLQGHLVHVFCPRDKEVLYRDFAVLNQVPVAGEASGFTKADVQVIPPGRCVIRYQPQGQEARLRDQKFYEQAFIKYGTPGKGVDVVIHARNRTTRGDQNWRGQNYLDLATRLLEDGFTVAQIGLSAVIKYLPIAEIEDKRDIALDELCDVLASARCIVGTSSGPMHLASLCGCPQVVFSGACNERRYREHWNPFKTRVAMPEMSWDPAVDSVYEAVVKMIVDTEEDDGSEGDLG